MFIWASDISFKTLTHQKQIFLPHGGPLLPPLRAPQPRAPPLLLLLKGSLFFWTFGKNQGGRGHWTLKYTGPQSFINTVSY